MHDYTAVVHCFDTLLNFHSEWLAGVPKQENVKSPPLQETKAQRWATENLFAV
jgi:hypothetical protein